MEREKRGADRSPQRSYGQILRVATRVDDLYAYEVEVTS